MASISDTTVTVHLDFDLNGEPVTHTMRTPASVESDKRGMTLHLHLDGAQLAKALLPELMALIRQQTRTGVDTVARRSL